MFKSIFTVYSDVLNDENNRIEMTYKRVSYYRKMNDMDTFITVLYKNKISIPEIINKLKTSFNVTVGLILFFQIGFHK